MRFAARLLVSCCAALAVVVALGACGWTDSEAGPDLGPPPIQTRPGIEGPQVEELSIDKSPPRLLEASVPDTTSVDMSAPGSRGEGSSPPDGLIGGPDLRAPVVTTGSLEPLSGPEPAAPSPEPTPANGDIAVTDSAPVPPAPSPSGLDEADESSGDSETGPAVDAAPASVPDLSAADEVASTAASADGQSRPPLYDNPSEDLALAAGGELELEGSSTSTTTRGLTANSITVGGIVTQSLVGVPYNEGVCAGAAARYAQANASGELTRNIVFDQCFDDLASAGVTNGLVRSLVDTGVFAIAPVASPAFQAAELLNTNHVPYVGSGDLPAFCSRHNSYGFGTGGARNCPILPARSFLLLTTPVLTAWSAESPRSASGRIVYVAEDSVQGVDVRTARAYEAELLGLPITPLNVVPPMSVDVPSWSVVANQVLAEQPDVVMVEAAGGLPLVPALRQAGFSGEVVWVGTLDPLNLVSADRRAQLAGLTVVSPGIDLAATDSSAWQQLIDGATLIGYQGPRVAEEETDEGLVAAQQLVEDAERRARERADEQDEGTPVLPDESSEASETLFTITSDDPGLLGAGYVEGYLAADFLVRAIAATPEPLSAEALHDTVNGGWWYPGFGELACGGWWPAGHFIDVPCVSISRVDLFSPRLISIRGLSEVEPRWQDVLGEG